MKCMITGSFDPITLGHMALIERAMQEYEKVYVAVLVNEEKHYLFSMEERVYMAELATAGYPNVEVVSSTGMAYQLAQALDVARFVRGYRNEVDYAYEMEMARFNDQYGVSTILYPTSDAMGSISSTVVRDRLQCGQTIEDLVPTSISEYIQDRIVRKA